MRHRCRAPRCAPRYRAAGRSPAREPHEAYSRSRLRIRFLRMPLSRSVVAVDGSAGREDAKPTRSSRRHRRYSDARGLRTAATHGLMMIPGRHRTGADPTSWFNVPANLRRGGLRPAGCTRPCARRISARCRVHDDDLSGCRNSWTHRSKVAQESLRSWAGHVDRLIRGLALSLHGDPAANLSCPLHGQGQDVVPVSSCRRALGWD